MKQFTKKKPNPDFVLIELLQCYSNHHITEKDIIAELDTHPEYPSLLALSEVLRNFGVNSTAYEIDFDDLVELQFPFIAHTTNQNEPFLLFKSNTSDGFVVADQYDKDRFIDFKSLNLLYNNIVLIPEVHIVREHKSKRSLREQILIFPSLLAITVVICWTTFPLFFNLSDNLNLSVLIILKLAGVVLSIILISKTLKQNNLFANILCNSKNSGCDSILTSTQAIAFGNISWSEVGLVYFIGTLSHSLLSAAGLLGNQALIFANLLSLPFTLYSIYFQSRIAKKWCLLCTMIQIFL